MTIYLDVLVGLNTYICWILLYITKLLTHTAIKLRNLALASIIGGMSSLICLLDNRSLSVKLVYFTLSAASLIIIFAITFYGVGIRRTIPSLLIYLTLNITLNGAINMIPSAGLISYNGVIYADISLIILIMTTVLIYILITTVSRIREYHITKHNSYKVLVEYNGAEYEIDAIADTGNTAHDYVTGKPVIICQGISLYSDENSPVCIIPYNTVNSMGILYAVKPDIIVIIDEKGNRKQVSALCAAIASKTQVAIFNPSLLI